MAKRYDTLLRLLLVGDTGVGKTCLICQYASNEFHESHLTTIGVDFKMKVIDLDGRKVKVQIWDTAGQERFEAITKQSFTRAQGCILVYDICSRSSFESLGKWILFVRRYAKEDTAVILIGNKSDLEDKRQVSRATAQQFADQNNLRYYEASAKNLESLKQPFEDLCHDIVRGKSRSPFINNENIDLTASQPVLTNTKDSSDRRNRNKYY
ncbi:unnamed protein product [Candidula unifasciata]|uniref:Uncharacterized protein n=1 Tax=Candidula unifasciata TaxID=100452 RepID=A0A8S4AD86_9EUPU|nr:unnamed protein product [Candidula unifasciata]